MKSKLEAAADTLIGRAGYYFQAQFEFHPTRKWRADFLVWADYGSMRDVAYRPTPGRNCLVEIEGIPKYRLSRHQHRDTFALDCEKYNAAAVLGWTVLRFTGNMVADGTMERTLKEYFR